MIDSGKKINLLIKLNGLSMNNVHIHLLSLHMSAAKTMTDADIEKS
jgi:hypothetical protein